LRRHGAVEVFKKGRVPVGRVLAEKVQAGKVKVPRCVSEHHVACKPHKGLEAPD